MNIDEVAKQIHEQYLNADKSIRNGVGQEFLDLVKECENPDLVLRLMEIKRLERIADALEIMTGAI